jgi:hypothetical protein
MRVILSNFNHERWLMCGVAVGAQRVIVEECLKYDWCCLKLRCSKLIVHIGGQNSGRFSESHYMLKQLCDPNLPRC